MKRSWPLLGCAGINLYLLGAACLLGAAPYPLLAEVPPEALPAFHASLVHRIALAYIAPEFLAFLAVLPLFWLRPKEVPVWTVWACLILGLVYFAITFGWHLPMQALLARGDASPPVMGQLLGSHALRTLSLALKCGLLLWMVAAALRGPAKDA